MKKLMMMSASVIALGAMAQEVPVPPPVVAVETTVSVPAVPATSVVAAAPVVELEPGALCKTYLLGLQKVIGTEALREEISEKLETAEPIDLIYDVKSLKFDAKTLPTHKFNVAVWEGVFEAKKAGKYVFTINAGLYDYFFEINGEKMRGSGQNTLVAHLNSGINAIKIIRLINTNSDLTSRGIRIAHNGGDPRAFSIDYRFASSTKPAKPITPNMLKHIVEDEEEW